MIEEGMFARLSTDVGLSALIFSRVFPVMVPQNSQPPYVVFTQDGRQNGATFCDVESLVQKQYQLDCMSKSYFEAKRVADAVRACLNNFSGLMGETRIDRVLLENEQDLFDEEPGLFRVSQTFLFQYQEF